MPATATSFGDGRFGIGANETGFIIENISHNYTSSNKTVKDRAGNTSGITYYDEMVSVSLKGKIPKTTPFSGTIAASLTLSNPLSAYLKSGATAGLTIIESINVEYVSEEYSSFSIEAKNYPNVTS